MMAAVSKEKSAFQPYGLYEIGNRDLKVSVTPYGATMISIIYHGRELLLGYDSVAGYETGTSYVGAVVGRYANRIGNASFSLNGKEYHLDANEQDKCIHGGRKAFSHRAWEVEEASENSVTMKLHSPDGDNGFPGDMDARVTYSVEGSCLSILFEGEADGDTVYNPTTHAYFNLGGQKDIRSTLVSIRADRYVHTDEKLLPDGILPVEDWLDLRKERPIRDTFDHCFVLTGGEGADMTARFNGVRMELKTDFPGLQLYTGKHLSSPHHAYAGFAAEPQYYPDTPNHKEFPSCVLRKGEHFKKYVSYDFSQDM